MSMSDYVFDATPPLIPGDSAFSDIAVSNNARIYNNLGVDGNVYLHGTVRSFSTIDATSTTTGSFIISGGVGIQKQLWVGSETAGSLLVTGSEKVNGTLTATTITDGQFSTTNGNFTSATILGTSNVVAANYLNTTGAAVKVSGSAPPTAGQILTATGPTAAIWQVAGANIGFAEYIYTTQSPNNSVPPGTAFTVSTLVYNSIPSTIVVSAGAGGTVWTLSAGTYVIDYETSLGSAGSMGIYTGPSAGSLTLDPNTVAGSTTATTWIHGRAMETVATTLVVAISSVVGTAAVVTAGTDAGSYMIRVSFLKIA